MIRVFVAGDTRIYSEGVARLLSQGFGIEVTGHTNRRSACLADARDSKPDVVLIDIAMRNSHDTIREIVAGCPSVRVVAMGVPETEESAIGCVEAGASGYVAREASLSELVQAIESATHDELLCSPHIARAFARRISAMAQARPFSHVKNMLTTRETQVGDLLIYGLSNKEIANKLHLSESTVKQHVHHLLEKLKVQRRGQAAALLRET